MVGNARRRPLWRRMAVVLLLAPLSVIILVNAALFLPRLLAPKHLGMAGPVKKYGTVRYIYPDWEPERTYGYIVDSSGIPTIPIAQEARFGDCRRWGFCVGDNRVWIEWPSRVTPLFLFPASGDFEILFVWSDTQKTDHDLLGATLEALLDQKAVWAVGDVLAALRSEAKAEICRDRHGVRVRFETRTPFGDYVVCDYWEAGIRAGVRGYSVCRPPIPSGTRRLMICTPNGLKRISWEKGILFLVVEKEAQLMGEIVPWDGDRSSLAEAVDKGIVSDKHANPRPLADLPGVRIEELPLNLSIPLSISEGLDLTPPSAKSVPEGDEKAIEE